jgi:MoaA/NifB/PqqE/SkfB family radical SAM enzyme
MDNLPYRDFIIRHSKKARQKSRLLYVIWELTYKCNLNCQHCYIPAKTKQNLGGELTFGQIKNIIDQLYGLGCLGITLTGGEIFFRTDAVQILEYLRDKSFSISVLTNGTLITEKIAGLLRTFNPPVDLSISLNSLDKIRHSRIVGTKGALETTLNSIKLLKEKNIPFSIMMLLMRNNAQEFEAVRSFANKLNVHFQYDYVVFPRLDGSQDVLRHQISAKAIRRLEGKENSYLNPNDVCGQLKHLRFSKNKLFYCDGGDISMAINPYGKANICVNLAFPGFDVLEGGVGECWEKMLRFVRRIKPSKDYQCYKCELGNFCRWCPAMAYCHKGDLNPCLPFYKKLARIEKRSLHASERR